MATATATKTKASVAKFKIKSPNNFILFLKRFSALPEKALIVELTSDSLKAKGHTPDRAIIKYSKMSIGDVLEGDVPSDLIKIPILDINKVIGLFKHFGEADEVFMDLKYDNANDEAIGTEIVFRTSNLKIKVECADMSLFTYISGEMLKKIISATKDGAVIEFPFKREFFTKINSLCSIDAASDALNIKIHDGIVKFKGKSFEYDIDNVPKDAEIDFSFYNSHFGYIEQEISSFHVGPERILVKSSESDTMIVISRLE
jgi:hypothetical protein